MYVTDVLKVKSNLKLYCKLLTPKCELSKFVIPIGYWLLYYIIYISKKKCYPIFKIRYNRIIIIFSDYFKIQINLGILIILDIVILFNHLSAIKFFFLLRH